MLDSHQIILRKPVSALNTSINLNLKAFFTNTAKSLVAGISGQASTSIEYGLDSLKEISFKKSPEEAAWHLVITSFLRAFSQSVHTYKDLLTKSVTNEDIEELAQRVEHQLSVVSISIDADFFERPQDLKLFDEFKPTLNLWLNIFGLNTPQAEAFQYYLQRHFILTLNETWGHNQEKYECIFQALHTPFTRATMNEVSWESYSLWLKTEANSRVFGEAFGLEQVYIPLRAYYKKKETEDEVEQKYVCDLHQTIHSWIVSFDKAHAIKAINGGPGSGKSSFAKILASEVIDKKIAPRVLFIPLHRFNMSNSLEDAVGEFIDDNRYLKSNPMSKEGLQKRLLLIFDGLDELSEQGVAARTAAENFMDNLIRLIERKNDNDNQWQAIVTGRDLSLQANKHNLKKAGQVLYLLPYRIEAPNNYTDKDDLLKINQCNLWWKKFGLANGKNYEALPEELDSSELFPITAEPLLNYLLAISYESEKLDLENAKNLNNIYRILIREVYDRNYAEGYQHLAIKHLEFNQFLDVLEEISVAVWHGNGRTASERYILDRCDKAELTPYLERFSENASKGVVKLLTAFYFREFSTNSSNDRTFEFTHKSFGEYLTARRIVGFASDISEEVLRKKNNHRKGWSHEYALEKWISLTGQTPINDNLFNFIRNEITRLSEEAQLSIQNTFIKLLSIAVRDGSPVEKVGHLPFSQMLEYSNNSEIALLLIHSACAENTGFTSESNFGQNFERWLKRVDCPGWLTSPMNNLRYLSLSGQRFYMMLSGANFSFSKITDCDFSLCDLTEASFDGANIEETYFSYTDLETASFYYAHIDECSFEGAKLKRTDFEHSTIMHSYFEDDGLKGLNLKGADITGCDLTRLDLEGTNFEGANLESTILIGSNLEHANLKSANLKKANISKSNLKGASLDNANMKEANLMTCNLEDADLKGANLKRANLKDANLLRADFENVNLKKANLEGTMLEGKETTDLTILTNFKF